LALDITAIRSDIHQLVCRYAVAVDSRDVETLAGLFWPADEQDPDAFRAATHARFASNLARVGASFLNVGTYVIDDVTETTATGLVYTKSEFELAGVWTEQAILYRDRYRFAAGAWRFTERVHELWYGAARGVDPLTLPPANYPASHVGTGTVPGTWESWERFWSEHPGAARA
jgi:hypothetical protein